MNVGKIGLACSGCGPKPTNFCAYENKNEYENPVSRGTERNLAVLSATCGSVVFGAIAFGLASCFKHPEWAKGCGFKGFTSAFKMPLIAGATAVVVSLLVTLPAKIYNTKVNAFVKQKEMDVFTRDRELKSNLTEQVGDEVKDEEVSLDKKLDDNLKLQMANRGAAVGIANVTPQVQPQA